MSDELPIPPSADADSEATEMIRVWLANRKVHCVLNVGAFEQQDSDELRVWGILLADMIHHVANAHEDLYERCPDETRRIILKVIETELAYPTSARLGDFLRDE